MSEVTVLTAFAAGALALLSPCSALLLPSFFAYAFERRAALVSRTVVFTVGLAAVLVPLGMGSTLAARLVYGHRQTTLRVAGAVIIVLGLYQALGRGFTLPFTRRLQQVGSRVDRRGGFLSSFALGAVYGLAGFCSGPVLGAVLTMAATSGTAAAGGLLLAAYAVGMAVPLFVLALLWDRFDLGQRRWLRGREIGLGPIRTHTTSLVSGLLFVVVGAAFIAFDGMVGFAGAVGLGDTSDTEFAAQDRMTRWLGGVPGWVVPAAVAVVAALVAWRRMVPADVGSADEAEPAVPDDDAGEHDPADGTDRAREATAR